MGNRVRRIIQIGQKEALMAQEFYDDENQELVRTAGDEEHGRRLDQVLASLYSDYSRSKIKKWIEEGRVTLDGRVCTVPRTGAGS